MSWFGFFGAEALSAGDAMHDEDGLDADRREEERKIEKAVREDGLKRTFNAQEQDPINASSEVQGSTSLKARRQMAGCRR
jgi:hypothetical protein